jgi:hypothetical protein
MGEKRWIERREEAGGEGLAKAAVSRLNAQGRRREADGGRISSDAILKLHKLPITTIGIKR